MQQQEPTNTDIMVKLSKMSDAQDRSNETIEQHTKAIESVSGRVLDLEKWQIAFKAAENALANIGTNRSTSNTDSAYTTINKDLLKLIGQILAIVSVVVGIVYVIISKTL